MSIYLSIIVKCDKSGCTTEAPARGTLSAQIGDGGRIDVEIEEELPTGWVYVRGYDGGLRCPEHAGDKIL